MAWVWNLDLWTYLDLFGAMAYTLVALSWCSHQQAEKQRGDMSLCRDRSCQLRLELWKHRHCHPAWKQPSPIHFSEYLHPWYHETATAKVQKLIKKKARGNASDWRSLQALAKLPTACCSSSPLAEDKRRIWAVGSLHQMSVWKHLGVSENKTCCTHKMALSWAKWGSQPRNDGALKKKTGAMLRPCSDCIIWTRFFRHKSLLQLSHHVSRVSTLSSLSDGIPGRQASYCGSDLWKFVRLQIVIWACSKPEMSSLHWWWVARISPNGFW